VFGLVIERTIIRFLYGRMIDTMLATWGLSLALVGAVTMIFGNTTSGVSTPLGSMSFGRYELSNYNFAIIGIAALTTLALFCALRFTRFGIIARATMQNPQMVGSLGVNSAYVYAVTFAIGAALSGLAGGMIAPLSGVVPAMGGQYVAKAFITVISGGSGAVVAGTLSASTVLGTLDTSMTFLTTPVFGEVSLLVGAVLLVRALPQGITGRLFRGAI
jgi:branched-subunit amino acid ABC-type transport system permease component